MTTKSRKIYCKPCRKYLGEIRDATLHKKIVFLCGDCETKRLSLELMNKTDNKNPIGGIFGGIFK